MARAPCLALLFLLALAGHAVGQSCNVQDFSVMYDGQAYFTVSSLNGTVSVSGPMTVGGLAAFPSGMAVGKSASFTGPLTAAGPTTLAGIVTATNGITIANGGLQMTAGNNLVSGGAATFAGLLTANGAVTTTDITASGGITVSGSGVAVNNGGVTINNNGGLTINGGGLTVANGQPVNIGTTTSSTPLNVWGPATFRNGLTVTATGLVVSNGVPVTFGTSGTTTPTTVYGLLTVTNGITLTGGSVALGSATVTGTPAFSGLITANGGITLGASQTLSLPPSGTLALNGAAVTGMPSLSVSGLLTVTNGITLTGGSVALGSATVTGTPAFSGLITANGGITLGASQTLSLPPSGTLALNGAAVTGMPSLSVSGLLTVTNGITLTGGSVALGSATVTGTPAFSGLITANGGITLGASQTLSLPPSGTLALNGAAVTGMASLSASGSVTATSFVGSAASLTNLGSQPEFAAVAAKVSAMATAGAINGACQTTSDCSGSLVCYRDQCKVRFGNSCTAHQQCMSDVHGCIGGVCSYYTSCSAMRTVNPGQPSGYYPIVLTGGRRTSLWCNFDTPDEGWTVVWSNHRYGTGKAMTNLAWTNAISGVYQWKAASNTNVMPQAFNPEDLAHFVGLSFWAGLAPRGRLRYDWATDYGQPIVQRYECNYTLTTTKYVITFTNCQQRIGSTVPGLVGGHNNQPFTTTDVKNDQNPTNCANLYSGTPWWYTSCWSGNINGGGETSQNGYYNGAYWYASAPQWGLSDGTGAGNGWIMVS
eukprot:TRINITY_DN866_c0_g1_i3.p1 TRINITY_DN866_c0_g1~~TRINITY_DN866_c0_g1_i3.p1  ORF type:complete len:767 (+),score=243.84 TRINITY_DN866_c0_g1_i3:251-2551(+)